MEEKDVLEELSDIVGPDAAKQLADHYAGSSLYIPKSIGIKKKHREIREAFANGASYRKLAMHYGLTERYIRRIVHKKSIRRQN